MLSSQKIHIPHPASQYSKYRSQSKTNALLHRLNNDSGYPQDIICSPFANQSKNYVHLNKQNLKNFFADRIPNCQAKLANISQTFDPVRLYQIKKQQYQLRHNGQLTLNGAIKITSQQQIHKERIRKISEIFSLNDKNLQFKMKYFDVTNRNAATAYPPENYRRGTKCFADKKQSLTKKQAYEKVFGLDLSLIVKTSKYSEKKKLFNKTDSNFNAKSTSVPLKIVTQRKKQSQKQTNSKERITQFRRMISHIKQYNEEFSSNIHQKDLQKAERKDNPLPVEQLQQNDTGTIIQWMKNCSKQYENEYNKNTTVQLKNIEDLEKIDSEFYEKMHEHKRRRLSKRMDLVDKSSVYEITLRNSPLTTRKQKDQDRISMISEITVSQAQEPKLTKRNTTIISKKKITVQERFFKFCEELKKILQYSIFYGVPKKNIFSAFWKMSQPYQKEGSYSFFKAIKRGQLETVIAFIQKDVEFAFQVDEKKRSSLINAIRYNHQEIVQYLLSVGVNVDCECSARKKPLYYAITNRNQVIVQKLLQNGALPWSSKYCNYSQLNKSKQTEILLKNAKKIQIASRLQKWTQRLNFWNKSKKLIVADKLIMFDDTQ